MTDASLATVSTRRPPALLRAENITKTYRDGVETVWACREVNLEIFPGELVWLRGVSGGGKSTLLMALAGLVGVDEGSIYLGNSLYSNASAKARARMRLTEVGIVFQDFLLLEEFTAAENVMLPLEAMGTSPAEAPAEAARWLEVVGLAQLNDRRPAQLSGGQRQRVAVARALAGGKSLILADEPTGSLDSATSHEIFALLRSLADQGVAIVMASHDPSFSDFADVVYDIRDGILTRIPVPAERS